MAQPEDPKNSAPLAPAVRVHKLIFQYPDGRQALRGTSFVIDPGECVALVGPNGAGKSTLLWHLNGLLPAHKSGPALGRNGPSTGPGLEQQSGVWIDGLMVTPRTAHEIRRRVGLLFQDPDDQLFSTTVRADVAFGPLNLGKSKAQAHAIAEECLARVELLQEAERLPHHLSFGEKKRVCLAGVLACSPSVLLLDEPTANLDPRGRRTFMNLIRSLEATRLIATHDLEMVLDLCQRVIVLDRGTVVADGPSRQILSDERLMEDHGLEVPPSLARERERLEVRLPE